MCAPLSQLLSPAQSQMLSIGSGPSSPSSSLSLESLTLNQKPAAIATAAANWRLAGDMRRVRARVVVLIERMLRGHCPHGVLTEIPENMNWQNKTLKLSLKLEKLLFQASRSREQYFDEKTLKRRVQLLSRQLLRARLRRNAPGPAPTA